MSGCKMIKENAEKLAHKEVLKNDVRKQVIANVRTPYNHGKEYLPDETVRRLAAQILCVLEPAVEVKQVKIDIASYYKHIALSDFTNEEFNAVIFAVDYLYERGYLNADTKWLPIEDAPRDEEILVAYDEPFFGATLKEVTTGCWHTDLGEDEKEIGLCFSHSILGADVTRKILRPTHFQYLPEPPKDLI